MAVDKVFMGFLGLLVWLPLPFASEHDWSVLLALIWVGILLLIRFSQLLSGDHATSLLFKRKQIWGVLFIWIMWLFYIVWQTLGNFMLATQAAAMDTNTLIIQLSNIKQYSYSLDHSVNGILQTFLFLGMFLLTLLLVKQHIYLKWLAWTLVLSGTAQALYGIVMTLSGLEYGFFIEKLHYRGTATGTFINRNHFANYLVMCLAVGIGLLIAQLGSGGADHWRARLRSLITWILSPKMLLRLMLVIMVIALVLSRSRMGNTSFFVAMSVAGVIALLLSRHASRSVTILLISLIVIDIFIVGTWFGLEKVKDRLENTSIISETRDEITRDSFDYWQDYFMTGSGLGSYRYVIPKYQDPTVIGWYAQAHNDYLEFATETGIIGLSLLGALLLSSLAAAVITQHRRRTPLLRGIGFAATMAILALLIHAHVEFNFQITANAATASVILALAWIALYFPHQQRYSPKSSPNHYPVSGLLRLSSIVGIVLSGLLLVVALAAFVADRQANAAQAYLDNGTSTAQWQNARQAAESAIRLHPWRASYHTLYAQVLLGQPDVDAAQLAELNRQGLAQILASIRYQPANAINWANILIMKENMGEFDAAFKRALLRAIETGVPFLHVQQTVLRSGLNAWSLLNYEEQQAVLEFFERGLQDRSMKKTLLAIWHGSERASVVCELDAPVTLRLSVCRRQVN